MFNKKICVSVFSKMITRKHTTILSYTISNDRIDSFIIGSGKTHCMTSRFLLIGGTITDNHTLRYYVGNVCKTVMDAYPLDFISYVQESDKVISQESVYAHLYHYLILPI